MLKRLLLAGVVGAAAGLGAESTDLIAAGTQWTAGIDRGGTQMTLGPTADARLAVAVSADGTPEDYPKLRQAWNEPQDWVAFTRIRVRVRVSCADPAVRSKVVALVFYDQNTRRLDLPDRPMTQQVLSRSIPVNRWIEYRDWLVSISRTTIRQLDLYLYEVPPAGAHQYRWEFAELALEGVGEHAVGFDTQVYAREKLATVQPAPVAGSIHTSDGLALSLGTDGAIASLAVEGTTLGAPSGQPTGLLLRDAATNNPPVAAGGTVTAGEAGIRQQARVDSLGLGLDATYRVAGEYIEVQGTVSDLRGQDRAVTLYLGLPLADAPWVWWDSVATARRPVPDAAELMYLETGAQYGTNGAHSKYPLGAVTWPGTGGLTLAVRQDEPVVHRLGYSSGLRLFFAALDFGLVPETTVGGRSLGTVPFRLLLYRHDPAWGFRSALARYYAFFPDFFTVRARRQGGWYVWGDVSQTAQALEAGFGFHWGPASNAAVKWDNEHQVLALLYIEPEFFQQTMGDFDRAPTSTEALERLGRTAAGDTAELAKFEKLAYARSYTPGSWIAEHSLRESLGTVSAAAVASVNWDADLAPCASVGQYPWMSESQWGIIFPCNLDPDIPRGKGWFCHRIYLDYGLRDPAGLGAHYDGIGLDSLGGYGQFGRANYRREHFRYAETPLCFSALDYRPVQVAAFATLEWVRSLAQDMHARGLVLMANCSWGVTPAWLTFAAPYLDIFGAEAPVFADPDYARAIAYRKPCTDLPYTPRPDWEIAWHQLHGIFPGHGNEVGVMARFAAPLRQLAAAGWEPIPHARVEPDSVRVERYGSGSTIYLVLHNPKPEAVPVRLTVDAAALHLTQPQLHRAVAPQEVPLADGVASVELAAQGTEVFTLSNR